MNGFFSEQARRRALSTARRRLGCAFPGLRSGLILALVMGSLAVSAGGCSPRDSGVGGDGDAAVFPAAAMSTGGGVIAGRRSSGDVVTLTVAIPGSMPGGPESWAGKDVAVCLRSPRRPTSMRLVSVFCADGRTHCAGLVETSASEAALVLASLDPTAALAVAARAEDCPAL